MKRNLAWATAVVAVVSSLQPAEAGVWFESGNAGDLPGIAQSTVGVGALTDIFGAISSSSDQDMFLLNITDPGAFSASTNNPDTSLSSDDDTQLFLFNTAGFGLLANDDDPLGSNFKSNMTAGSFGGPAGLYLLGISIFDNDPLSADGKIFPDPDPSNVVVGPTGPGGGSPITSWDIDPDPSQTGKYRIALTGASFAEIVPEPSALTLWSLGVVTLIGLSWRRRKRVA